MWSQQNAKRCCHFQALSPAAEKTSLLWAVIENLMKGTSWNYRRPFLIIEARYFQATTLGLPVEISKYYNTLTAVTVNGEESKATTVHSRSSWAFDIIKNWVLFAFQLKLP